MKKSALALCLILVLSLVCAVCLGDTDFKALMESEGYKVYEMDDMLVMMYEVGPDATPNNLQTPTFENIEGVSEDEINAYTEQFNRVLFFITRNDKIYLGGELKPPFNTNNNEANGLFSAEALAEMFVAGGGTVTTNP